MKNMKKLFSLLLALVMVLGLAVSANAAGDASITIKNAANGETYSVVKIFDATPNADNSSIVYTGTIPAGLTDVFTKNASGNIVVIEGKTDKEVTDAVAAWAATQSATATKTGEGGAVTFTDLEYGYYAVLSTQGTAVTVTSTNPNATVTDKNSKDITAVKTVEKTSYSIGDTVKYTATFGTVNYYKDQVVIKYTITDTLPEFLKDVKIDSIEITKKDGTPATTISNESFADGKIEIEWATEVAGSNPKEYKSLYENGAQIIVNYSGTLTSVTNINAADKNTVEIIPTFIKDDGNEGEPTDEHWKDSAEIYTYAAALKKTDGTNALAGAKFKVKGLTVEKTDDGVYTVVSYNPASDAALGNEMEVDASGKLYIVGLASSVTLTATETEAPAGYNKTDAAITLTPQVMETAIYTATKDIYYDADGNVVSEQEDATTTVNRTKNLSELDENAVEVVNKSGSILPSTGGMGTTMIYTIGGILVVAAVVLLVTKKRMAR